MLHTMITASNPQFKGKISSLLEELLAAAVTEICELFDNEFANVTLRAECPKCKHSKEVERPNLSPRRSSPSRNFHKLSSRDEDPQRDCSRGEFERNINADVEDQHIMPQCSEWDMGTCNEQSKYAGKEMASKVELVSIKQEVVEECELQTEGEGGHEGVTGLDIILPDPGLSTTVSSHRDLQWPPPESFVHADSNSEPKFESENGRSTNKDELSENSGLGDLDNYHEQQEPSTWNSDMAASTHHASNPSLMQRRDCGRVRQEEVQRAEVGLGSTHFTHWAMSTLRNQTYLHKQWSRCRKTSGSVNVHSVNLSEAVSIDTRADGSGNHLNMPFTADQEKRFTCQLCGKRLLSEQTLKSHQKIHTGYAPHQCNQCGKRFSRLENLKVHQNIHTGLKPYTCKFCLKKFNAPSNFNRHKRACLKRKLSQFSS